MPEFISLDRVLCCVCAKSHFGLVRNALTTSTPAIPITISSRFYFGVCVSATFPTSVSVAFRVPYTYKLLKSEPHPRAADIVLFFIGPTARKKVF